MKLEVFFDYACPYCYTGLGYLRKLIPAHPDIEIIWWPCEAHPRPERYGIHSDLAIMGLFFVLDKAGDAWAYHDRIFRAIFDERRNIEDADVLAECVAGLDIDAAGFRSALENTGYAEAVREGNRYAWGENRLQAVPSYKMGGRLLGSRDGRPVSESQLASFLQPA